jgi:hypothetical protein
VASILFSGHLRYAASVITQQSLLGNALEVTNLATGVKQRVLSSPEIDETFLASQLAWDNFMTHGVLVSDVMSWLLMFASAAFSILLIKKTFAYLGSENHYWNLYESWKNKDNELEKAKSTYISSVDGIYKSQTKLIQSIADDSEIRIGQLQAMWDEYYAELDKFEHYVAEVEGACNRSLSKYRSINRSIATDPSPSYFDSKFTMPEIKNLKGQFCAEYQHTGIDVIKPVVANVISFAKEVMRQIEKKREKKLVEISTNLYQQLKIA